MKNSEKKVGDYLRELPPAPKLNLEVNTCQVPTHLTEQTGWRNQGLGFNPRNALLSP